MDDTIKDIGKRHRTGVDAITNVSPEILEMINKFKADNPDMSDTEMLRRSLAIVRKFNTKSGKSTDD